MTIEKKVEEILKKFHDKSLANFYGDGLKEATQAILTLIKPMSREKLKETIRNYRCKFCFIHKDNANYIGNDNSIGLADAILAEWGKG